MLVVEVVELDHNKILKGLVELVDLVVVEKVVMVLV